MKPCPKCFEQNSQDAEYCRECGAPLKAGVEGSDKEVYAELAAANFQRNKKNFKEATDTCISILKRFPNNVSAQNLLGDIASEQQDWDQAKIWYEMTLDLAPDNVSVREKLAQVEAHLKSSEAKHASDIIGIPEHSAKPARYLALVIVAIFAVGALSFIVGKMTASGSTKDSAVQRPVEIEKPLENKPAPVASSPAQDEPVNEPKTEGPVHSGSDSALLNALNAQDQDKLGIISLTEDPRGPSAIMTLNGSATAQNVQVTQAGLLFFKVFPAYKKVTMRVLRGGEISFVADMTAEAAKTASAAIDGGDSIESQSQVMLSQIWTPPHAADSNLPQSKN